MKHLDTVSLPKIGTRYDFVTDSGHHIHFVVQHDGRWLISLFDGDNLDESLGTVVVEPQETTWIPHVLNGAPQSSTQPDS